MSIGANLKKYRKEKGLKQTELADLSSIPRVSISRYESGIREPNAYIIKKLAEALDVTIQELIVGEKLDAKAIEKDISIFSTKELIDELYRRIV